MPGVDREVRFCFLAQPTDVNFGGKVHGGMVMKWIDQAGYACAVAWSGQYCVTVAVGGIRFVNPILIGDMVTVHCQLIYTGNTSMHFSVDVIARRLETGEEKLATHCVIVMVATDRTASRLPCRNGCRKAMTTGLWRPMRRSSWSSTRTSNKRSPATGMRRIWPGSTVSRPEKQNCP